MEEDFFTEERLQQILELMKNRRELDHPVNYDAIRETSILLVDGILLKLMKYISKAIDVVSVSKILETPESSISPSLNTNGPNQEATNLDRLKELDWTLLRLSAEIIFFALYQSQVEVEEAIVLLEIIHQLSDLLSKTLDDFSTTSVSNLALMAASSTPSPLQFKSHVTTSFLYVLIVLQLSHVCAHQQIAKLLSRKKNYYNKKSFEIEPGNHLAQKRNSKYGLDRQSWKCPGVKGFTNLVFAVFRQPEVDADKCPKEDVEWFMHEACVLRGYSYIRLCLLPMIRTSAIVKYEYSLFFIAVLAELLENLAKVFVFSYYDHNEHDFPYIFFPPTLEFYLQNLNFYQGILEEGQHSRMSPFKRTPNSSHLMNISMMGPPEMRQMTSNLVLDVDTLRDVLNLYIDALQFYPSFATIFWGEIDIDAAAESEELNEEGIEDLMHSRMHPPLHEFHPFITKVIESAQYHRHLLLDTLRLLTALGNGPKGSTARLVYYLVSEGFLNRMDWDRIVDKITRFLHEFISEDERTVSLGGRLPASSSTGALITVSRSISPIDLEGILIFVELIGTVSMRRSVADQFIQNYQLLPKLFSLVACPIPIEIKGSVLTTLSKIARFPQYHPEIWELLDQSGLCSSLFVPLQPDETFPGKSSSSYPLHRQIKGIKAELEENESRTGRYPVTLGFLLLIRNLLQYRVNTPEEVGYVEYNALGKGIRIPGILPYLEYILEDIFMKIHDRYYFPEDSLNVITQRWRITSYCLEIFNYLLRLYPIHQYDRAMFLKTLFAASPSSVAAAWGGVSHHASSEDLDPHILDFKEEYLSIDRSATSSTALVVAGSHPHRSQLLPGTGATASSPSKFKVPKTPGFYLLAMILNNSKFTELIMKIIATVDRNYLLQGLKTQTMNDFLMIYEIYKYGFVHQKLKSRLQFLFTGKDRFVPYASAHFYGSGGNPSSSSLETALINPEHEFHLSDAMVDPLATNTVLWLERSLMNSLLFLYEILIRESSFRYFFQNCRHTLLLTKYDIHRRYQLSPTLPLHPSPFFDILKGYGLIPKLLPLLSLEFITLPSVPIPNIIIIKIMEQLLLQQPSAFLLPLFASTESTTTGSNSNGKMTDNHAMDYSQILESFVNCLLQQRDIPSYLYDESDLSETHYHLYLDNSSGANAPMFLYSLLQGNPDFDPQNHQYIATPFSNHQLYGSMRSAIIAMMLNTLVTSRTDTFNHFLLGLRASSVFQSTSHYFSPLSSSLFAPTKTTISSQDCFHALVQMMSPNHQFVQHFFLRYPDQSLMIYELFYRLASSSSVGKQTLAKLRTASLPATATTTGAATATATRAATTPSSFLLEHFSYLLQLLALSKEELIKLLLELDVITLPSFATTAAAAGGGRSSSEESSFEEEMQQKLLMKLYEIHTAMNHAFAFLLKILNCELSLSFLTGSSSTTALNDSSTTMRMRLLDPLTDEHYYVNLKAILEVLFFQSSILSVSDTREGQSDTTTATGRRSNEERINFLQLLYYAYHEEELLSLSPAIQQSLQEVLDPHIAASASTASFAASSQYKYLPTMLQVLRQTMQFKSSSSREIDQQLPLSLSKGLEADSIACPLYRWIPVAEAVHKFQEAISLSFAKGSGTGGAGGAMMTPGRFPAPAGQDPHSSPAAFERVMENLSRLSILFNQQEKLSASRNHLLLAARQFVDCCFLPMMKNPAAPTTTACSSSISSSSGNPTAGEGIAAVGSEGRMNLVMKATLELFLNYHGPTTVTTTFSSATILAWKNYLFQELLLPLIGFTREHYQEVGEDSSVAKVAMMKSFVTILSFLSSASSAAAVASSSNCSLGVAMARASQQAHDPQQYSIFIYAWKELIEHLYHLLLLSNRQMTPHHSLGGGGSGGGSIIHYLKFFFSSLAENAPGNTTAFGGISEPMLSLLPLKSSSSSSSASAAGTMTIRGYLLLAFQLTLKLFGSIESSKVVSMRGIKSPVLAGNLWFFPPEEATVEDGSSAKEEKAAVNEDPSSAASPMRGAFIHLQPFLEQSIIPLIDQLIPVAMDGFFPLRINALYTLTMLFQTLLTNEDQEEEDHSPPVLFWKVIQYMSQKGYFQLLWQRSLAEISASSSSAAASTSFGSFASTSTSTTAPSSQLSKEQSSLYLTTLQLFHHLLRWTKRDQVVIPTGSRGSRELVSLFFDQGLVEEVCYSRYFGQVVSHLLAAFTSSSSNAPATAIAARRSLLDTELAIFQETLSFFVTLLGSSSSSSSSSSLGMSKPLLQSLLAFFQRYRGEFFSPLLHQPLHSLLQLDCLDSFLAFSLLLMERLLAVSPEEGEEEVDRQKEREVTTPRYRSNYQKLSLWLKKDLDLLITDLFSLLQLFAEKPLVPSLLLDFFQSKLPLLSTTTTPGLSGGGFPAYFQQMKALIQLRQKAQRDGSSSFSSWWKMIVPTQTFTQERHQLESSWQRTSVASSAVGKEHSLLVPSQWTVLDQMKLDKSLTILFQTVNLLRIVSVPERSLLILSDPSSSTVYAERTPSSSSSSFSLLRSSFFQAPLLLQLLQETVLTMMEVQYFHDSLVQANHSHNHSMRMMAAGLTHRSQRLHWLSCYQSTPEFLSLFRNLDNEQRASLAPSIYIHFQTMMIAENLVITLYQLTFAEMMTRRKQQMDHQTTPIVLGPEEQAFYNRLFQIGELLPVNGFCRIVLKWIYEEINATS